MSVNDHGGREPPTNYVKQMNAFIEQSAGVLGAKEQAVYLRLFGVWNSLMRPEWITVSNTQLMRELKIKSEHTVIKIREQLCHKGFLISRSTGQGKMIAYHMPILYSDTPVKNAVVPLQKMQGTPAKNAGYPCKKCSGTPAKNADIIKSKDIKRSTTTTGAAVEFYQNNIRPICSGYELERLQDDIQHYGEDTVIKAIQRAVTRNKRSIGYVEGILRRWETDGFDKEGEHGRSSSGYAGSHRRKAPRKDCTDWDDPNADFGGW